MPACLLGFLLEVEAVAARSPALAAQGFSPIQSNTLSRALSELSLAADDAILSYAMIAWYGVFKWWNT